MSRGQQPREFGAHVVLVMAQRERQDAAGNQDAPDLGVKLCSIVAVELRGGRIGHVHDHHVVMFVGPLHEAPAVGAHGPDPRISEVFRQEPAAGRDDQRVDLHVGDLVHAIAQDLARGAGHAAAEQQDLLRVRALAHCVVNGLLYLVDVLRGDHRDAVLIKSELARVLGHHEPAVGRIGPKHRGLSPVLDGGGDFVRVDQRHMEDQPRRHDDRGRQQQPPAEVPRKRDGQQEVQGCGETQQGEVVEPRHEHETEEDAAADAPETVGDVHTADRRGAFARRRAAVQQGAGQREQGAGDEAEGEQQRQAAEHGAGHAHGGAAEKDDVAQHAHRDHLPERDDRHEHQPHDQGFGGVLEARRTPRQPGAGAGQQQPAAKADAEHQFVSGKRAEEFAHQHELRHDGGHAEAADGEKHEAARAVRQGRRVDHGVPSTTDDTDAHGWI